jgi:uncharacterized protein YcbK (DUF882 family)
MIEDDWKNIQHFTKDENWGDWKKMNVAVVWMLDRMRDFIERPIVLHCGYEDGGHTENSQHYLGNAVDCHIVGLSLIDQYLLAERFNWNGIGVYPDFNNPGLHLDCRTLLANDISKRWACYKINGVNDYVQLDKHVFKYIIDKGV